MSQEGGNEIESRAKWRLLALGALVSFSSLFQMGYCQAYPNTAIEGFRDFLNESFIKRGQEFSEVKFTWLWSAILNIWFIGFAVGSWLSVPVADRFGRKRGVLLGNAGSLISIFLLDLSVFLYVPELLLIGRLVAAVSAAVTMNTLILFLQEIAPTSMRGVLSFYAEFAFVFNNLVGVFAGMRPFFGHRLLALIAVAFGPAVIAVFVMLPFPDSPKFLLIAQHDRQSAVRAVKFYELLDDETSELVVDQMEEEELNDSSASISELIQKGAGRKGLLLAVLALQLTASLWPIIYLSTEFLVRVEISYSSAEWVSTAMTLLSTVCTAVGMSLIEKFGRRKLFLSTASLNVFSLLVFVVSANLHQIFPPANFGCIAATLLYGLSYSVGMGPIAWFIGAELVPLRQRAALQSLALSINQGVVLILSFITLPLYDAMGSLTLLPLFILPGSACIFYLYRHLPETKGREIHEIIKELEGKVSEESKKLRAGG